MLEQPVPNPLAKNPNFNTHKVFAAIGIILIVMVIIGGGIWYMVQSAENKAGSVDDNTTIKTATSSAKTATSSSATFSQYKPVYYNKPKSISETDTTNLTKDWKLFETATRDLSETNHLVKYSIKHPLDYIEISDEGATLVTNLINNQDLFQLTKPGDIKAFADINYQDNPKLSTDEVIGGKSAKRYVSSDEGSTIMNVSYRISEVISQDGKSVSFVYSCSYIPKEGIDLLKTCDLMASTLKFL